MSPKWADNAPIYQQLANALAEAISDGSIAEGTVLPPVRELATRYLVNPSVVARALMGLQTASLIELTDDLRPRVTADAQRRARAREKEQFVSDEWPKLRTELVRLGIGPSDLL